MDRYENYSLDELLRMPQQEEILDRILAILEQQCSDLLSQRAAVAQLVAAE